MRITKSTELEMFKTYFGVQKSGYGVKIDSFNKLNNSESTNQNILNRYEAVFTERKEADVFASNLRVNLLF